MNALIQVILLGIVEGITEFLPISSTGHLLIAEHWLGERPEMFNVVIQLGAILAVVFIYRERLWDLIVNFRQGENRDYLIKLGTSFGITVVFGLIVVKIFKWKLTEALLPVAWALTIGGVLIIIAEMYLKQHASSKEVSWPIAIAVGFAQIVAGVFPGSSRSGSTIVASMFLGQNRAAATEFSFLLGIPTMFAASVFAIHKNRHEPGAFSMHNIDEMVVGFIVSAIVGFVAVKWLLRYIQTHSFIPFGWYRIAVGISLFIYVAKHPGMF